MSHPLFFMVGGFNHLEKYEFVNGKDDIPYNMENKKCLKPPTRKKVYPLVNIQKAIENGPVEIVGIFP